MDWLFFIRNKRFTSRSDRCDEGTTTPEARRHLVSRRYFVCSAGRWAPTGTLLCAASQRGPTLVKEDVPEHSLESSSRGKSMRMTGTGAQAALKNIIFATDFSPEAERAGKFATGIAKHSSSRVLILHVLDPSTVLHMPDAGIAVEMSLREAEQRLAERVAQLRAAQIEAEAILSEGTQTTKVVLELATERAADLIVIGTRGLGALGRLTLGSVAQQLIHEAECAVLTVGPHMKAPQEIKFQRIVCATDFSEDATAAVEFAFLFTQSYGAHMFLCHVLPKPDSKHPVDTQELNERFKAELRRQIPEMVREWCDPECVVDYGYAVDGILLLANRVKADLIVLGTRRFSHWFENIRAGIAFEVIRKADCPVLTVQKQEARPFQV